MPVPGQPYTFSVLKQAQALGDYQALLAHGRRALRVDLDNEIEAGLRRTLEVVAGTTRPAAAKKPSASRNGARRGAQRPPAGRKAASRKKVA